MSVTREMRAQVANIVGPGYGEIYCLVADRNDAYGALLRRRGVTPGSIFVSLAEAEDAMVTDRNDTLLVFPGDHAVTSSITWDKDVTNIIGVGSPNQAYQPATLTNGGVRLTCTTAAVAEIVNITGHYVSLYGIGTYNSANNAGNYCDIRVSGKNIYMKRVSLRGGNGAAQLAAVGSGVPLIVDTSVAGAGNGLLVEDSILGSSGNSARTKGPGCLSFTGGAAAGFGMKFKNCRLSTRIQTATSDSVGLVNLVTNYAVDRELEFEDTTFYNFTENLGTGPTYVFRDACTTTHQIVLKGNCAMNIGFTSWTDAATYLSCSVPSGNLTGGIGLNA